MYCNQYTTYCLSCLCADRKVRSIDEIGPLISEINIWDVMPTSGGLCWECDAIAQKFTRFKRKARLAQDMIASRQKGQILKRLSTLSSKIKTSFDYEYDHSKNYEKSNIKSELNHIIKKEKVENNDSNNDNYDSDCDSSDSDKNYMISDEIEIDILQDIDMIEDIEVNALVIKPDVNEEQNQPNNLTKTQCRKEKLNTVHTKPPNKHEITLDLTSLKKENKDSTDNDSENVDLKSPLSGTNTDKTKKTSKDMCTEYSNSNKEDSKVSKSNKDVTGSRADLESNHKLNLCNSDSKVIFKLKHDLLANCKKEEKKEGPFTCQLCNKVVKSKACLKRHHRTTHSASAGLRPCKECGSILKTQDSLRSHMRRFHKLTSNKHEHVCSVCKKLFTSLSRLQCHLVSHGDSYARQLTYCDVCQIQYNSIHSYRAHLKVTKNHVQDAHKCPQCGKTFAGLRAMGQHVKYVHQKEMDTRFRCQPCNKTFISRFRLGLHSQSQHGAYRPRSHACPRCDKAFFTKVTLKNHILTHSSLRAFMCADCGDTFKQQAALYTHCKLVHKQTDKPTVHTTIHNSI